MNTDKLFLTRLEVQKTLQISAATLRRRVLSGEIPSVHLGRRVLFPRTYFENLASQACAAVSGGFH